MRHPLHGYLRILLLVIVLALAACASVAPFLAKEVHMHLVPGETAVEYATAGHSGTAVKKIITQKRSLPLPTLYLIFLILTLGMQDRSIRMRIRLYPAVLLLRRIVMLTPLKFTSSYVGRPISSLT